MKLKLLAAALLLGGAAMAPASAAQIGFEDVPGLAGSADGLAWLQDLSNYAGIDWTASSNWAIVGTTSGLGSYLDQLVTADSVLGRVASGSAYALLQSGEQVTLTSATNSLFSVGEATFSTNLRTDSGTLLSYSYERGGTTYAGSFALGANQVSTVNFNLTNVSSFSFWTSRDVSYDNLNVTTAVPEPASLALTGLGVAALAFKRRRAQRQVAAA